jgi:hypothetical protein
MGSPGGAVNARAESPPLEAAACIGEEVGTVGQFEEVEEVADSLPESVNRAFLRLAQVGFEL